MENNYFFIDGSSLIVDICTLQQEEIYRNCRFIVKEFISSFFYMSQFGPLHNHSYRRVVFYFVNEDQQRVKKYINLPELGAVDDVYVKYCGKKIKRSFRVEKWLNNNNVPDYVMERFSKSEKAVDTQLCCDALQLAGINKLDRLFLYTNDFDFLPLCETLKQLGVNVSLFQLRDNRVNKNLASEFDTFGTFSNEEIKRCFGIK